MQIIRRFNVLDKEVSDQLKRLNATADPGTRWVEGKSHEQGKTPLWLVEESTAKAAANKK